MPVRTLFIFFILLYPCLFFAQQEKNVPALRSDKDRIELEKLTAQSVQKKKRGLGNAMLSFYQRVLSPIIAADCVYSPSCSRFSREAINSKGLIKGILLSADRLTRCSYTCSKDIPDHKFNNDGLAEDHP
jgi:putative component of membrane protein insertase Oxa1/YidC/SpoIIIJ protein YidD